MKRIICFMTSVCLFTCAAETKASNEMASLPIDIQKIMTKPIYSHAKWGLIVKDMTAEKMLYQMNVNNFMIPASASKTLSVTALLNVLGPNYTFKTPVYALGTMSKEGVLNGDLILVAKGDLVLGGRVNKDNKIDYTNFDHIDANSLPGATLTTEDPLAGLKLLAKQIKNKGLKVLNGKVLVDDSLFETITKRENILSPIMINENMYDIEVTPGNLNKVANLMLRPRLKTTTVVNKVMTVEKGKASGITISRDELKDTFEITGSIALDDERIVNTYPMENPKAFSIAAFSEALQQEGIVIKNEQDKHSQVGDYTGMKPIAVLESPPLLEYAKLILKVSHNMGANLAPLLIASAHHKKSYNEGMRYIGDFIQYKLGIQPTEISFGDAAGGNDNYITPVAMMNLLTYVHRQPTQQFHDFMSALPILGVDGSLSIVATNSPAKGHVFAKTGTGIIYNKLFGNFLLTSKALVGFYQSKNQHWIGFFVVVNQGNLNDVMDVLKVNDDLGLIASELYQYSN